MKDYMNMFSPLKFYDSIEEVYNKEYEVEAAKKIKFVKFTTRYNTTIKLWGTRDDVIKTLRLMFQFDDSSIEIINRKFDEYDKELLIDIKSEDDL